MADKTYWNGEETPAWRGTAVVTPAPEFPEYWAQDLVGERIDVVQVYYAAQTSYLDNRHGKGWRKVTEGNGGPRFPHANVSIKPGSFRAAKDGA